jgi:lipopolysaccharide transport system ATP-binding protein
MIAGTLTPTQGEIAVNGRVAALLQLGSGFNDEFTGRENVYLSGAVMGLSQDEIADRFEDIVAFAEIGDFLDQPVRTYSSGMKMRLAFAVSTAFAPEVLIVDEALSVGDMKFQFKCRNRIQQLIHDGTTLLFVSHEIGAVKGFCSEAVYMKAGRVYAQGAAGDVVRLYLHESANDESAQSAVVKEPPPLGGGGTGGVPCCSARFTAAAGDHAHFEFGETVEITVACGVPACAQEAELSLRIQTQNLFMVAGKCVKLPAGDKERRFVVKFCIPACFLHYKYFVTTKMNWFEDRGRVIQREGTAEPTLSFEVIGAADPSSIGCVEVGIDVHIEEPT